MSPTKDSLVRRKRALAGVRREQILSAAFEVASRVGVANLTIRGVATEVGVSHALVLYHFGRKDDLLHGLLEWLIEATSVLELSEDISRFPRAIDRLHAQLQQEMVRISCQTRHVRLFFEYWAVGARDESIRTRISGEIERYRAAFLAITTELILAEPAAFPDVTAEGLAAVAVSWIQGCAVQATIDPEHFDADQYFMTVRGIIGRFA